MRWAIKCFYRRGKLFIREDTKSKEGLLIIFRCKYRECPATLVYRRKKITSDGALASYLEIKTFKNLHNHKKSKDPEKAKKQ